MRDEQKRDRNEVLIIPEDPPLFKFLIQWDQASEIYGKITVHKFEKQSLIRF